MNVSRITYVLIQALLRPALAAIFRPSSRLWRRNVFWALGRSAGLDLFCVRGPDAAYVVDLADSSIAQEIFICGGYERDKVQLVVTALSQRGIKRPPTIVDVGANVGTVCISSLSVALFDSAVAIEPDRTNARLLRANIALNGLDSRVRVFECAAGERADQLIFERSSSNFGDHRVRMSPAGGAYYEETRETVEVAAQTIDALLRQAGCETDACLLWIDVQGFEGQALSGAAQTLLSLPPVVVEFWPYGLKRAHGFPLLQTALSNYSVFLDLSDLRAGWQSLSALGGLFDRLSGPAQYTDLLFVK